LLLAVLGIATALAAGAVPAFTAGNGTILGTVNVPLPPAPCLTQNGATVDFGTLPFADPAASGLALQTASPAIRVTSCSPAPEKILGAASDATIPSGGSWDAGDANVANTCTVGLNHYQPGWTKNNVLQGRLYNPRPDGSFAAQSPPTLAAGGAVDVSFWLQMPCRGSVGAGETASMTFFMLAVLE
jgi:hypothetical protein